jgi:hypothetical protein
MDKKTVFLDYDQETNTIYSHAPAPIEDFLQLALALDQARLRFVGLRGDSVRYAFINRLGAGNESAKSQFKNIVEFINEKHKDPKLDYVFRGPIARRALEARQADLFSQAAREASIISTASMPRVCGHDGHYGNGVYPRDMRRLAALTGGALYVFDGDDGKNVVSRYRYLDCARVSCDWGADPRATTMAQMRAGAFSTHSGGSVSGSASGLDEPLLRGTCSGI